MYALVYLHVGESAEERVKAILHQLCSELQASGEEMSVTLSPESITSKVVVVEGNISQANFGLSDQLYQQVTAEVDVIIHAAAEVNSVLPYAGV